MACLDERLVRHELDEVHLANMRRLDGWSLDPLDRLPEDIVVRVFKKLELKAWYFFEGQTCSPQQLFFRICSSSLRGYSLIATVGKSLVVAT